MYTRLEGTVATAKAFTVMVTIALSAFSGMLPSPSSASSQSQSGQFIPYGAAIDPHKLNNKAYVAAIIRYCQQIVPETGMKWRDIQSKRGKFNFELADKVVNFGKEHGIAVRGHPLVWGHPGKLPDWTKHIVDKDEAKNELVKHITKVMSRYKDRIKSWDVINEPIDVSENNEYNLRNSIWYEKLGLEYIALAFRTARSIDPKAELVLNEFGIEVDKPEYRDKREALYKLVFKLWEMGVPIDAVGIQSHLGGHLKVDTEGLRKFVGDLRKLNIKVLITELDVKDYQIPQHINDNDRDDKIAEKVEQLLQAIETPNAVLTWGITDKYSWLFKDERFKREDGRPLPLDSNYKPKLMMDVIQKFRRSKR